MQNNRSLYASDAYFVAFCKQKKRKNVLFESRSDLNKLFVPSTTEIQKYY